MSKTLLQLQASYDEMQTRRMEKVVAVRTYAPSFMNITAAQIEAWPDQIPASSQLPAFLRRLVLSTGSDFSKVDFPAFNNAERPGWDGHGRRYRVDTAWRLRLGVRLQQGAAPEGRTRLRRARRRDPDHRTKETTFVFVTPCNWPGKDDWARAKRSENIWKDVRAFDASDLEQWIEQSVPENELARTRMVFSLSLSLSLDGEPWLKGRLLPPKAKVKRSNCVGYTNKINDLCPQRRLPLR